MDTIKLKIQSDLFENLIKTGALHMYDVDIIQKEPEDFDYSKNDLWVMAKKDSIKAYKKLKEIEFHIRNS